MRQTVLAGPVDTNGFAAFGGSTGSTTVTASGTLTATAANGVAGDRTGSITNPSWTGLSTNGTMYLFLNIAADGTCTTGSTTLAPTYRWGGADVTTNNQFTFNIQEMVGKVGNGATAAQTYRVFVGEVTASGTVSAITWYALMGRYDSGFTATLPASGVTTSFNHNIGINPMVKSFLVEVTTTEFGYAVGEQVYVAASGSSVPSIPAIPSTRNAVALTAGNAATGWVITTRTSGETSGLTRANYRYKLTAQRGW